MKDYKRLTDRVIAEMLRNTEGESWDSDNVEAQCYIRLAELEDKIESGELVDHNEYLDHLLSVRTISELTDKEIEFFVKHNARVREDADAEIARLTAENAELKKRLENAVELPCIEPMTTWDWDDTTGLGKNNFGKYWQVLYRDENGEFIAYIGATKEEAEARLAELKGGMV